MNNNQNNNTLSPQPPMAGTPYQMPPKKKSKGVLWGIIGGVIGLIIIIVGIVLAIVFLSGPSKADYKDAVSLVSQMKLPESKDIFKDVKKSDDYEEVINKVINSADEAHAKFASNKVFKDIEVKEAYDKYLKVWNDEAKPYLKYVGIFNKEGVRVKSILLFFDKISRIYNKRTMKNWVFYLFSIVY